MTMIDIKQAKDLARLRRLALSAQGLLQAQPFGRGLSGTKNAIKHLGYIQIDTISVVERAHHHVLHSRVPDFKPPMLNQLLLGGDIFEYWSHAAAFLPMHDFRFSLPYKEAIKSGQTHWYKDPDTKLMAELLERVKSEGPLRSRDVETKTIKRAGWWDWKPAKKALEQLYMQGDLMVCNREGFQKTYDLTERVLPDYVNTRVPNLEEFSEKMLEQQLACHGFTSLKSLTYLRRNSGLRHAIKRLVDAKIEQGDLEQLRLETGDVFIIKKGALENTLPRLNKRLMILSPFDNSVIQRERLKAVFGFEYQIECYVPEAKRQYGYFSLPLLYRGDFIGRMDCKSHRKDRHFEIKSLHIESACFEKTGSDQDTMIHAFVEAISIFAQFQNCDTVSLIQVNPTTLLPILIDALKPLR